DPEIFAEFIVSDVRWQAPRLADPEIDRRLAEVQRHQLRMGVGEIKDRQRPQGIEAQDVRLCQTLLGSDPAEGTKAAAGQESGGRSRRLQEFTLRYHCRLAEVARCGTAAIARRPTSADGELVLRHVVRAVVVLPGEGELTALDRLEEEGLVWIGRDRRKPFGLE